MLKLALDSLWNRRFFVVLSVVSIALSVALLCGVERLRTEARESFANSASGVDMVVAARGNPVQILLSAVFGLGATGAGLDWETFEHFESLPQVAWAVPIASGDNHAGFPVVGTTGSYFEHVGITGGNPLRFEAGTVFADAQGAVVGAEVARRLGYVLGSEIVLAHGAGDVAFTLHDDAPFAITGILQSTGGAVDRMVFVSLEGFDALHPEEENLSEDPLDGFVGGMLAGALDENSPDPNHHDAHSHEDLHAAHEDEHAHEETHATHEDEHAHEEMHAGHDDEHGHEDEHAHKGAEGHGHDHAHAPGQINAVLIGLADRRAILSVQQTASSYTQEPVTAVIPNVALLELWALTGTAEAALSIISAAVVFVGILGMVVLIAASVEPRRREFAILRSVGATPAQVFTLILIEALIITLAGILVGYTLLSALVIVANPLLMPSFGLSVGLGMNLPNEPLLILAVIACSLVASLYPAVRVYRMTLSDGLTIRM